MKVYVVMKGEYSDKRVVGVVSTPEKAEQAVKYTSDKFDESYYYEYELDNALCGYADDKVVHMIEFDDDGIAEIVRTFGIKDVERTFGDEPNWDFECYLDVYERLAYNVAVVDGISSRFCIAVAEADETKAIKIAAEQRAMYLARKHGVC